MPIAIRIRNGAKGLGSKVNSMVINHIKLNGFSVQNKATSSYCVCGFVECLIKCEFNIVRCEWSAIVPYYIFFNFKCISCSFNYLLYTFQPNRVNSKSEFLRNKPEKIKPSTDDDGESVERIRFKYVGSPPR